MEKLENILQQVCEGRKPKEGSEPVPDGDITIINGKKSKMDVDKLVGKSEKNTNGSFSIDYFENDPEAESRWEGEDKPRNVKQVLSKMQAEEPFFILGHAGWGKSTIIKQCAYKEHRNVITVYLDKACKEDIGGIPVPVANKDGSHELKVLMPGWAQFMWDNPENEYLLFFDEMNQADPEVMNALMPVVLDNTICGIKFDNFTVGAAGNYKDENDATHELSGPLRSRFEPIIIWKDADDESWKDWIKYFKKKLETTYKDKFYGRGMEVLEVLEPYLGVDENGNSWFKNPREIETRIFDWMDKLIVRHGKDLKTGGVIDEGIIEDRLKALMATGKDLSKLEDYKNEVVSKKEMKEAVEKMANVIYAVLVNGETKEQQRNRKPVTIQNDELKLIAEHYAKKVKGTKKIGSGWVGIEDNDGNPVVDANGEQIRIAASEDTFCAVLGYSMQEKKYYESIYKDDAFRFKTEKECIDALKNDSSTKDLTILTREEALKIPAVVAAGLSVDSGWDQK